MRTKRQVDVRVPALGFPHRLQRQIVVRIGAHEVMVVLIADGRNVVLQHAANDAVLVPQRHKNRDRLLFQVVKLRGSGEGDPGSNLEDTAPHPPPQAGQVQEQVIQAAYQYPNGQQDQAGGYPTVHQAHGLSRDTTPTVC